MWMGKGSNAQQVLLSANKLYTCIYSLLFVLSHWLSAPFTGEKAETIGHHVAGEANRTHNRHKEAGPYPIEQCLLLAGVAPILGGSESPSPWVCARGAVLETPLVGQKAELENPESSEGHETLMWQPHAHVLHFTVYKAFPCLFYRFSQQSLFGVDKTQI